MFNRHDSGQTLMEVLVALAILGITVLILSKAYMDYSTSGLENPATHLLLIIFLFVYLRSDLNLRTFFWLCLIAGLAALNRMDTLLLYIPALGYAFVTLKNWKAIFIGVTGFLPFVLWELFSVFFYGSFFPNTAYAKLNTNIGAWELTERGLYYLQNSLLIDPLTLLIVATAIIVPFIGNINILSQEARSLLRYQ